MSYTQGRVDLVKGPRGTRKSATQGWDPRGHVGRGHRSRTGASSGEPEPRQLRRARKTATGHLSGRGLALWNGWSTALPVVVVSTAVVAGIVAGDEWRRRWLQAVVGVGDATGARTN